jgi:hypothetical protein
MRLFPSRTDGYYYTPRVPRHPEQYPYNPYNCSREAWWQWVRSDPERWDWYQLGLWIKERRKVELEAWRQAYRDKYKRWPDVWIGPLISPWSEAAMWKQIDEPVFCNPPWYRPYRRSRERTTLPERKDPLLLDLDGDGIETISLDAGTCFDHNGDGFAEQTAWVGSDDGVLALDRNGDGIISDGKELFGNDTMLRDSTTATNGFEALVELDSNKDGKIDESDAAFSKLKVLKGLSENGYEVYTLDELGIKSINLDSTITNTTDSQGNTQFRAGSFEWVDGTTGEIAEYGFPTDRSYSFPVAWLDVPEDIAAFPDLQGSGNVYDLHQAMVRDTSGQLKSLVEQFITATDPGLRNTLMEQMLFKWTGSDIIDPGSRGNSIDARKVAVLEKWFGEPWVGVDGPNPNYTASIDLNEAYREIFEMNYAELMAQTHLKELYDKLTYTWDEENQEARTDFRDAIPAILTELNNDPVQGKQLLSEFARTLRGISSCSPGCYLTFREHMLEIDPDLGWVFDTGGLPVYDHPHQGIRPWSPHIEGTHNADAIRGSRTEGDGYLNGLNGNDVIYGTTLPETLINETGDALLVGGGGGDIVWAGSGSDIVDGGPDNDLLFGEAGNDTYIFRRGSGQDTISDYDATPNNMDTIWLGSNLTPEDIILKRLGYNLVLKIEDTSDTLTVRGFFSPESSVNRIERIQFMDGTVWTDSDIIREVYAPTDGDDTIYGGIENDELNSLGGNDTIYGRGGDDTLEGGPETTNFTVRKVMIPS